MLILIMFWAAQLVLGGVIWAGLRIARREPNLASRLAAVTEIRHRSTRLDAARREIVWARSEIDIVVEQLDRAHRRLNELIPLPEPSISVVWFVVLTWILYEGESGVALLLNLASRFANMSDAVAAFVSPLVAVALFAALHVILGSAIQIGAEHRPQCVLRRARLGAVIAGAAVLLAASLVLSGRSFTTDPQMVETIASWGLLTLALLLSVAGAFGSLVVTTLNDERAVERRIGRLQRLKTAFERHVEAVECDIDLQDGPPSNVSPLTAVGGGSAALAVVLAALLAAPAAAQATGPAHVEKAVDVRADAKTVSEKVVTPHSCETLVDVSSSVDASARQQAVERVASDLDTLVTVFRCMVLRYSAFSGDPPFNVLQELPSLPEVAPVKSCDAAAASADGGAAIGQAVRTLYPNVRQARQGDAVRSCASSEQLRYDGDIRNRQKALDEARTVWRAVARTPARGSCTALDFAVRRAMGRSRHVLILSDGANTCEASRVKSSPQLIAGQTLTFLLLPSSGADAAGRGFRHMARLETTYSSSRVLFFSELTPSLWRLLSSPN